MTKRKVCRAQRKFLPPLLPGSIASNIGRFFPRLLPFPSLLLLLRAQLFSAMLRSTMFVFVFAVIFRCFLNIVTPMALRKVYTLSFEFYHITA